MAYDVKSRPSFAYHSRRQVTQADKHLPLPAAGHATACHAFTDRGSYSTSTHAFVKSSQEAFRPVRVRASAGTLEPASDSIGGIAIHARNTTVRYDL